MRVEIHAIGTCGPLLLHHAPENIRSLAEVVAKWRQDDARNCG
jgi:hypothetical protein